MKKIEPPIEKKSATDRLSAFLKAEKISLHQGYTLNVVDKYKNVIPQSVVDALALGMVEAKITLTAKDA